jgi:MoxR-like ATPase
MTTTTITPAFDLAVIAGKLKGVATELRGVVIERDPLIDALIIALIAQHHTILLGKPGRGKTQLANELTRRITGLVEFNLLLNKFLPPEELFGPVAISQLVNDVYERATAGFLPEAHVAVLDEVGKCNVASLNLMLGVMSDRTFCNGNTVIRAPLMSIIGTSNEIPNGDDLAALYDRFLIRFEVKALSTAGRKKMFSQRVPGGRQKPIPPTCTVDLAELAWLQDQLAQVDVPEPIVDAVMRIHDDLMAQGIEASDRRTATTKDLLCASALYHGRTVVIEDDLDVLLHVYWDRPDDMHAVRKIVGAMANPLKLKAVEILDMAQSQFDPIMAQLAKGSSPDVEKAASGAINLLKGHATELKRTMRANPGSPALTYLQEVLDQVVGMNERVFRKVTGRD